ncbi:MAG TPA: SDR family oxidoreductase [Longimicrobium sp.]|jgi:short-subunit dehydrogenase
MRIKLKPIDEQVMVITGADSGIGLATARAAAERGAKLVINSRNEEELASIAADLRSEFGAQVEWHAGDVADAHAMLEVAEVAIRAFGRIDTWVNNAAVAVYGELERVPVDDARRLFETNYWGVVNGSLAALPYLRAQGGALINVGSILSDRAIPLQGHYSATKHAVKAFTDSLRMELEHEGAPVSVTLVKPGAIDTPYPEHARNYMDAEPRHPQPVYAPEVVADAILECAQHPKRSITVGGGGRMMAMMGVLTPRLADRYMEATMYRQQKRKKPGSLPQDEALWAPSPLSGRTRGDQPGHIMKSSLYTKAALHPGRTVLALGAFGLGFALVKTAGQLIGERRAMEDADIEVQVRGPGEGVPSTEERYAHAGLDPAPGDGYRPDAGSDPAGRYGNGNGYGFGI